MKKSNQEFADSLKKGTIDYNNPRCEDCNECCSMMAIISEEEYVDLKKFFSKNKRGQEIYKMAVKRVIDGMTEHDALYFKCPLSSRSKRCAIYNKRPKVCRDFHCKPDMNKATDVNKIDTYGTKTIFELFRAELLKNKEYNFRLMAMVKCVIERYDDK